MILKLNRSTVYRHKQTEDKPINPVQLDLIERVKNIFKMSGNNYGSRRIKHALTAQNIHVGRYKVRRIMKAVGLKATWTRAFVKTTDSRHTLTVADNLLSQEFNPTAMNKAWVADITYIRTGSGWLYLAAVMDLYSRKIVGYSMSNRMTTDLVCTALQIAIHTRQPSAELIMHTDRGSQYCSHQYQDLLLRHGIQCSMSGKGLCYDNAVMERFFLNLKMERVWQQYYANHQEATKAISHYITVFYNQVRLHSTLGYISPYQFEQNTRKLPIDVSDFS
jgi:putative transposase